jgi:transcriptional regulator with GAF, ATPase, and Fis domain
MRARHQQPLGLKLTQRLRPIKMATTGETASGDARPLDTQQALSELGLIRLGAQSLNAALLRIADITKRSVPNVHEVSVTVMKGNTPRTAVFTGPLAVDLDERQYESGFGPCIDAAVSGDLILVDTNNADNPYPDFSRSARRAGINQVLSIGLPSTAQTPAGLNLYATDRRAMDPETVALLETLATYAAVAVGNAVTHSTTTELVEQIQELVKSRAVIEQAKGILMAQHNYSAADAFAALTHMSQNSNIRLRDVAGAIVTRISRHRPPGSELEGAPPPRQTGRSSTP